jgi:hypothetical protein
LRSGFYQPWTSHTQAKMLCHRLFHVNAMDRSVWLASTFLWLYLRHSSIPGANPMHPKDRAHTIWSFQHSFLATMSSSRPVGGFPRIENLEYDTDIILENSRQQMIGCDQIGFPASWNQHNSTLNDARPTYPHFVFVPCSSLDLSLLCFAILQAWIGAFYASKLRLAMLSISWGPSTCIHVFY